MEREVTKQETTTNGRSAIDEGIGRLYSIVLATGGRDRTYRSDTWVQRRRLLLSDLESQPLRIRKAVARLMHEYGY